MNEHQFEKALASLLTQFAPAARRKLNARIARKLRSRNQSRIQSQRSPDGAAYAPRKAKSRRVMFRRLRTARFMKTQATADKITVFFSGSSDRIARIHHYGLREKLGRKGKRVEIKYASRQLIGITDTDIDMISSEMLDFLAGSIVR